MSRKKGFFRGALIVAALAIPAAAFAANSGSYANGSIAEGAYMQAPAGSAGFGGSFNMNAGSVSWSGMTQVDGGGFVNGVTTVSHHGVGSVSGVAASGGYADEGHGFADAGTHSNSGSTSVAFGHGVFSQTSAGTEITTIAVH